MVIHVFVLQMYKGEKKKEEQKVHKLRDTDACVRAWVNAFLRSTEEIVVIISMICACVYTQH